MSYFKIVNVLFLFLLISCSKKEENQIKISPSTITESVYASGVVKAENQYVIYPLVSGVLKSIEVEVGEPVSENQVLFKIENEKAALSTDNARLTYQLNQENSRFIQDKIAEMETKVQSEKERFPSSGHSEKFISFIEEELQPFVEKKYNTNQEKTIIGQSLGGVLLTEILLEKPYLFNKYIIISPSLWWSNGAILQKNINKNYSEKIKVYIGVGKEGLTPSVAPRVMEVDANLLSDKLKGMKNKNIQVYFDYLPEENHATIMHQAVLNSFRLFSK